MTEVNLTGPVLSERSIRFVFPDPTRHFARVRLYQEISRPRDEPEFTYDGTAGLWTADLPIPDADRIEYLFELVHPDGGSEMVCDPGNPLRAPGPFGDKSVIQLPGYREPAWIARTPAAEGTVEEAALRCRPVKGRLRTLLWSAAGSDPGEPLPLLVVHDGPEYAALSRLTTFFDLMVEDGRLPRFRAALIAPSDRDQIYSASAAYARSLAHEILPALVERAPVPHGRGMRVGMGASLGALAMLHVHRRSPATFGGLFLQSGSYFRMRYDKQESWFVRFGRISRFVGEVLTAEEWAHPISVAVTCGTIEENLANNRAVSDALERQGYDVSFAVGRHGHNWIGWRDTFDPHLVQLLERLWS